VEVADLDDVRLQMVQDRLGEIVKSMTLQVIEQRDTKLLLVRAFDNAQVRFQSLLLIGFEISE
jgi:hypothetical protein